MHRITRCIVVPVFSASLFLLGGCFPTDDNDNNPTSPIINPNDTPILPDRPTDLPTDINPSANTSEAELIPSSIC